MVLKIIKSFQDFDFVKRLSEAGPVFLLKHGSLKQQSKKAYDEYVEFDKKYEELPCYAVSIQEAKQLSERIAMEMKVDTVDPQVIVLQNAGLFTHIDGNDLTLGALEHEYDKLYPKNTDAQPDKGNGTAEGTDDSTDIHDQKKESDS